MINEIENEEVANAMYAGTLLMSELKALTKNEYYISNCDLAYSALDGNMYSFVFRSKKAKRKISVIYSPPFSDSDLHCFNISIDSVDDRISLRTLINDHKLYNGVNYLDLDNYKGNTKQKIKEFVEFLDKVFTKNFPDIISGEKWEHIGFDWQGYK